MVVKFLDAKVKRRSSATILKLYHSAEAVSELSSSEELSWSNQEQLQHLSPMILYVILQSDDCYRSPINLK